jgi:phage terminase small subunit
MQKRFLTEYILDSSSGRAAAIRAGYSINSASDLASKMLKDPRVSKALQEANALAVKSLGLTAERVLQELWKIAGANPGDVVSLDSDGEGHIDLSGAAEVSVTTVSGGSKKVKSVTSKTVKPADKVSALDKVAKIMNLFPEKEKEVKVTLSLTELIEASMPTAPASTQEETPLEESPL